MIILAHKTGRQKKVKRRQRGTMHFAVTTGRPLKMFLVFALIVDANLIRRMSAPVEPTAKSDPSHSIASPPGGPLSTANATSVIFDDWGLESNRKDSLPSYHPSQIPSKSLSPFANLPDRPSVQPTDGSSLTPSESESQSPPPSSTPSTYPSLRPSMSLTNRSSLAASDPPLSDLSSQPPMSPTILSSLAPLEQPLSDPSSLPSMSPTNRPLLVPLEQPLSDPSSLPSMSPTNRPLLVPLEQPASDPLSLPSMSPTERPSLAPNASTSKSPIPSPDPSPKPSMSLTLAPSKKPTDSPSKLPSYSPSALPSETPSMNPTLAPSTAAPVFQAPLSLITTMCLVADTPYNEEQRQTLRNQVENLPDDCEFVFHLGDLRTSAGFNPCTRETYINASVIMSQSPKPVFMLLGDNEWNDCPNHHEALAFWHEEFDGFLDDKWSGARARFNVASQPGRIENIYFIHNNALFIGLNIVGGRVHNETEWEERLNSNFNWTRNLIQTHVMDAQDANVVVLMAHATPGDNHRLFFNPMRDYIEDELGNTVPVLYLNGDSHQWNYERDFHSQESWLRITVEGMSRAPILKVFVDGSASGGTVEEAFSYDRGL